MKSYLPEGYLLNTRENAINTSCYEKLRDASLKNDHLEARAVFCDGEHNLHVDFGFMHGIIPRTECALGIAEGTTRDIAIIARVNKPVRFTVTHFGITDGKPVAYLSRRAVQEDYIKSRLAALTPGDVIPARVTHLENFGAFCDIGCGINALLPIDNISVSRIPHPNARFSVGDDIRVIIKSFDGDGRVTLSHKELLGTWAENAAQFSPGETVSGIIRSVENYGVFVELTPNLAGLAEYTPNVSEGMNASVYIKSIIPEKMKFKLIIVDSFEADYPPAEFSYFTDADHISRFRYSPVSAAREIETVFDD